MLGIFYNLRALPSRTRYYWTRTEWRNDIRATSRNPGFLRVHETRKPRCRTYYDYARKCTTRSRVLSRSQSATLWRNRGAFHSFHALLAPIVSSFHFRALLTQTSSKSTYLAKSFRFFRLLALLSTNWTGSRFFQATRSYANYSSAAIYRHYILG